MSANIPVNPMPKLDRILRKLDRMSATMATKADLARVQRTLDSHTKSLDGFTRQRQEAKAEQAANRSAHRRFEARDKTFADKLGVDLDSVDARAAALVGDEHAGE